MQCANFRVLHELSHIALYWMGGGTQGCSAILWMQQCRSEGVLGCRRLWRDSQVSCKAEETSRHFLLTDWHTLAQATVHCTLHILHGKLYTEQQSVYMSYCTLFNSNCIALDTAQCTALFTILRRGDNRAVTGLSFTHITTKIWAYSVVFDFFRKQFLAKKTVPPTQIIF